jgi:hypothetical protein
VIGTGFSPKNIITIKSSNGVNFSLDGAYFSLDNIESLDGKTMFFHIPDLLNAPIPLTYSEDFMNYYKTTTNVVPGIYRLFVDNKEWEKTSMPVILK